MVQGLGHRARSARTPSCDAQQEHVNTFLLCASRPPNLYGSHSYQAKSSLADHKGLRRRMVQGVGFEPTKA